MYAIAIDSVKHDTLFYVERNKWSPEYPDAVKFKSETQAQSFLINLKRMNPENDKYQNAYVI